MEDYGLVSIVCPLYNCEKFVGRTIDSVLAQTYTNFELLVVDDMSTDNGCEVVKSYNDPRIILLSNEKNSGAAETRNNALRNAKGKWVAFLDSDDVWFPTKLEEQLKFMVENDYHFSFTDYIEIDEEDNELGIRVTSPKKVGRIRMNRFCYLGCLTVMYDRELVGLIQIDPNIKKRNDYAIWLKVSKKLKAYALKKDLAKYRRRKGSISNVSLKKLLKAHYILFRVSEKRCALVAFIQVFRNCFYGFLKKKINVKHYEVK